MLWLELYGAMSLPQLTERSLLKSLDIFLVRLPAARSPACCTKTLVHDQQQGAPTPQC